MFEITRHALKSGTWESVPVWSPSLIQLGYGLTEASLNVDLEDSGELSFAMPPGHPLYSLFDLNEVYVTECSVSETSADGTKKEIWRGFLTGSETDLQGVKTVNCRGVRSYLSMSIHQLVKRTYTTKTLLEALIDNHNAQMRLGGHAQNGLKLFRLGTVNVEGTVEVEKSSDDDENEEDYEPTLDIIQSRLIETFEGVLKIERASDGANVLSYLKQYDSTPANENQEIRYGGNLLDLGFTIETDEFYTAAYATGNLKSGDKSEKKVWGPIYNENAFGGSTYVGNFGVIFKHISVDEKTSMSALEAEAEKDLAKSVAVKKIEAKAADLSMINPDARMIGLGGHHRVIAPKSGLSEDGEPFECAAIDYDLLMWEKSDYTFGRKDKSLTKQQAATANNINSLSSEVKTKATTEYVDAAVQELENRYLDYVEDNAASGPFLVRKWHSGMQDIAGMGVAVTWDAWTAVGSTGFSKAQATVTVPFPFASTSYAASVISVSNEVTVLRCAHTAKNRITVTGMAPTGSEPANSNLDIIMFGIREQ